MVLGVSGVLLLEPPAQDNQETLYVYSLIAVAYPPGVEWSHHIICMLTMPRAVETTHRHFFRNLIKSNQNQILLAIFRLSWNQTDVRLVPNQSVHGKKNRISV